MNDTIVWTVDTIVQAESEFAFDRDSRVLMSSTTGQKVELQLGAYRDFWVQNIWPIYYEDNIELPALSLRNIGFPLPAEATNITVRDVFSDFGILPFHLESMHRKVTAAFEAKDAGTILRLCAEMGHYIGDAHVPLHTTEITTAS